MKIKILGLLTCLFFACQTQANSESTLDGVYDVFISIQGRDFVDRLTLAGALGPIDQFQFHGPITGTMEVPGSFVAPLKGNGSCSPWNTICVFKFSILAKENGREFEVNYKMQFGPDNFFDNDSPATLTGQAFLANGELLGKFTAVKQNE